MKRRQKLKVKFYDEARLLDRGGFTITWFRVALAAFLVAAVFILIGVGIVWFTPIKKKLPGYMAPAQRANTEEAVLRVDSLEEMSRVNQAYLENLMRVLDTDREPEVFQPDSFDHAKPLMPESLFVSSEIEREFMKKMEEAGYIIAIPDEYKENPDESNE